MATTTTTVDSTAYIQVHTAGTDAIIQNVGNFDLLVVFDAALPPATVSSYHILKANSNQAIQIVGGIPSGNVYVRAYGNRSAGTTLQNYPGRVAVST